MPRVAACEKIQRNTPAMELNMRTVQAHYESLLAPIYLWMAGGIENALTLGASDLVEFSGNPGFAIDLGAGFGMHAVPLARAGYRVLAIDTSEHLLEQLRSFAEGLPVEIVADDLLRFREHLAPNQQADLILCMGDTLTHLPDIAAVSSLVQLVARSLAPGGRFIATFRDYTNLPKDNARFIPVRSDAQRIHTCFLEERGERVLVHDIVHENRQGQWSMQISSYAKLRLSPEAVRQEFSSSGLRASIGPGPRGMVRLIAEV